MMSIYTDHKALQFLLNILYCTVIREVNEVGNGSAGVGLVNSLATSGFRSRMGQFAFASRTLQRNYEITELWAVKYFLGHGCDVSKR